MPTMKKAASIVIFATLTLQSAALLALQLSLPFPREAYETAAGAFVLLAFLVSLAVLAFWPDKPRKRQ